MLKTIEHIESDIPQEEQKYTGWFWNYLQQKFYRWSDTQQIASLVSDWEKMNKDINDKDPYDNDEYSRSHEVK